MVVPLSRFFCFRNVIDTVSGSLVRSRSSVVSPSLRKSTSSIVTTVVIRPRPASEYSHDLIAKKKAVTTSCPMALSRAVVLIARTLLTTSSGRACCDLGSGSSSANPFSCNVRTGSSRPAASWIGLSNL